MNHHGYVLVRDPDHPRANKKGYVFEHIKIVAAALGRPIPKGAHVHHANGVKSDNSRGNLVLCPDAAYHKLLHQRMRAKEATGNPRSRKCKYCKQWGTPENLVMQAKPYHPVCSAKFQRDKAARKHEERTEMRRRAGWSEAELAYLDYRSGRSRRMGLNA